MMLRFELRGRVLEVAAYSAPEGSEGSEGSSDSEGSLVRLELEDSDIAACACVSLGFV